MGRVDPPGAELPGDPPTEAGPRSASDRRIPLLVLGGLGLAGLVFVGLVVAFGFLAKQVPASAEDLARVLTVEDLAQWLEDYEPDRSKVTAYRQRHLDLTYEVDYTYSSDELHLNSSFTREHRPADALMTYGATKVGWRLGAGDLELQEHDPLRWGDQSEGHSILLEGRPIGNRFLARRGRDVLELTFTGLHFSDPHDFAELLRPLLERIEGLP